MTDVRLQHSLDESEIRSIIIRERFHRDHGEWEDWRGMYHPDPKKTEIHTSLFGLPQFVRHISLIIGSYHGDIDGFIELTKNTPGKFFDSFHTVSPAVIDINNGKALTKSLGTVNASFEMDSRRYDCVADVVMVTRLEYSTEGWRITSREGVYRRDRIVPATPPELVAEVNILERRFSDRNLDWLAHHGGKTFDRNVLGFDRPDELAAFLGKGKQWLMD